MSSLSQHLFRLKFVNHDGVIGVVCSAVGLKLLKEVDSFFVVSDQAYLEEAILLNSVKDGFRKKICM